MPELARREPNRFVFVNCPFDSEYTGLFRAICFAIIYCGFRPRCALERIDSSETRIAKICDLVGACDFGVHDLSRTELCPPGGLPRFNMPFELGLFLGCKYFGDEMQGRKSALILDRERYRYRQFLSDISGQDPESHERKPELAIAVVRNWLRTQAGELLPGAFCIHRLFLAFQQDLPAICRQCRLEDWEMCFEDLMAVMRLWLKAHWSEDSAIVSGDDQQTPFAIAAGISSGRGGNIGRVGRAQAHTGGD